MYLLVLAPMPPKRRITPRKSPPAKTPPGPADGGGRSGAAGASDPTPSILCNYPWEWYHQLFWAGAVLEAGGTVVTRVVSGDKVHSGEKLQLAVGILGFGCAVVLSGQKCRRGSVKTTENKGGKSPSGRDDLPQRLAFTSHARDKFELSENGAVATRTTGGFFNVHSYVASTDPLPRTGKHYAVFTMVKGASSHDCFIGLVPAKATVDDPDDEDVLWLKGNLFLGTSDGALCRPMVTDLYPRPDFLGRSSWVLKNRAYPYRQDWVSETHLGMQGAACKEDGERIGLLLDNEAGSLTVYRRFNVNGVDVDRRLGVAVSGLKVLEGTDGRWRCIPRVTLRGFKANPCHKSPHARRRFAMMGNARLSSTTARH